MKFLESCRLLFSTLSPVHIGCGEDYDPTNYVIDNNTLYEFEPGAAMTVMKAQDREQLLKIVSGNANDRMLQDIQQFFYQRRQSLIPAAKRRVPVGSALVAFYQKRVGQTVQIKGDNSRLVNKLEIERTYCNPINGAPILSGSSLKGAIRTALLDGINNGKPLQGSERSLALQQRLFRYDRFEQDPMRLVQLADAPFLDTEGIGSELHFAVNRRRKAPKQGEHSVQSQAEQRGLYQLLECVPAACFRAFAGQLTMQQVDSVNNHHDRLPALPLRWDAQQIAAACNLFYRPQLEAELAQMQERGYVDATWATMIGKLHSDPLKQRLDRNEVFLLRVGRHSGAESITLNGVRSIKILLDKDPETKKQRFENRSSGTSWWLAANDTQARTGMLPFGWLLVELQPMDLELSDWPEARDMLSGLPTEYTAWLEKEREQAAMVLQRQADETTRQAAAIAKLNATPEQKAITELRDWFIADRKSKQLKPLGRVVGTLNRLLKEGIAWPLEVRQELAILAEEIFNQKSVGGDDKEQHKRHAIIQQLREGATT